MFDLKRPCVNCPFRKGAGLTFKLGRRRIEEIVNSVAFQCHKTVEYGNDEAGTAGDKPQQCAGLMALLHKEEQPNVITRAAAVLLKFDAGQIEASDVYDSITDAIAEHSNE